MNKRIKKYIRLNLTYLALGMIFGLGLFPNVYGQISSISADSAWVMNFPKIRKVVEKLPSKENLYIFMMAGQSNMAGRGFVEPSDTISNPRILTLDHSNTWVYAKEPLHYYEPNLTGLDCGMSFARTLLDSIPEGISIAIIPTAVGGSSIEQWLNNETHREVALLDNFKEKVAFAQEFGIIKGIIWHQGESNANPKLIPSYGEKLESLLTLFRGIIQNDHLPIILGELGSYSEPQESRDNWNSINAIIQTVVANDPNLSLVETGDLKNKGDMVHFDSDSQRKLGNRYALKYLELYKQ